MNQADWLARACAALLLFFYLSQVPVVGALAVHGGGLGVGIGAFRFGGAVRRARERAVRPVSRPKRRALAMSVRDRRRILRFLTRHGSFEYLRVTGVVALSDAQRTCLAVGAIRALCAALGERGEARVAPAFAGRGAVEAEGVVSMRLMHVLAAVILALRAEAAGRIRIEKERKSFHGKVSH